MGKIMIAVNFISIMDGWGTYEWWKSNHRIGVDTPLRTIFLLF